MDNNPINLKKVARPQACCLFISAIGWLGDSVTFPLFPAYNPFVSQLVMTTGAIGAFPIMLWLLIKGVKNNATVTG